MSEASPEYAGFWIRVAASLIDSVLVLLIVFPLLLAIYGAAYFDPARTRLIAGPADFLLSWGAPAVAVVAFWVSRQATPGKSMFQLQVIRASGQRLRLGDAFARNAAKEIGLSLCGLLAVSARQGSSAWDRPCGTRVVQRIYE